MNTKIKKQAHKNRLGVLLLCVMMLVGLMPTIALAADAEIVGTVPTIEDLQPTLKVTCKHASAEHEQKEYEPIAGTYTISEVKEDGDHYTCTFTVRTDAYVSQYNNEIGTQHVAITSEEKSIDYFYVDGEWVAEYQNFLWVPVVTVQNAEELNPTVKVSCTNESVEHSEKTYSLIANTYTWSGVTADEDGGYTCTLTINTADYVSKYNTDIGATHKTQTETVNIDYTWKEDGWTAKTTNSAEVKAVCEVTAPTPTDSSTSDGATSTVPASPKTGDNSHMTLQIALLFISGGALVTLTVVDRKRRATNR